MLYFFQGFFFSVFIDSIDLKLAALMGIESDPFFGNINLIEDLYEKIQNGLTLDEIENIVILILFIRFIILSIRYNLKTSFFITCISLVSGYFWYKHLIDNIYYYRTVLIKIPFFYGLGLDGFQIRTITEQNLITQSKLRLGENINWYNPFQLIYYAIARGIKSIDAETGLTYYIDPISMIVAKLPESIKPYIVPVYYQFYVFGIPKIFIVFKSFWKRYGEIALYITITRLGKKYCPYLIRWHWTFSIIIGILEPIIQNFIRRCLHFRSILIFQYKMDLTNNYSLDYNNQLTILNEIIVTIVLANIVFLIFALFHAIAGQYFYFPFLVENVELHVGKRPINSIYSGGYTSWQDYQEKSPNNLFPKLWYGWFGREKNNIWLSNINRNLKKFVKKIIKRFSR